MNFPYGLTKLNQFISANKIQSSPLCQSLMKNNVPLVQLGNNKSSAVIIMARQHPGETVSSYVMQGIIQTLINQSQTSKELL